MFTEWNTEQKAKLLTTVPCYLDALLSHDFGVVRGSRLLIQTDMITSLLLSYGLVQMNHIFELHSNYD